MVILVLPGSGGMTAPRFPLLKSYSRFIIATRRPYAQAYISSWGLSTHRIPSEDARPYPRYWSISAPVRHLQTETVRAGGGTASARPCRWAAGGLWLAAWASRKTRKSRSPISRNDRQEIRQLSIG